MQFWSLSPKSLRRAIYAVSCVFVFAFLHFSCVAQQLTPIYNSGDPNDYRYYPDTKLALGIGFSPNDLADPKLPCIVFKEKSLSPGSASTHLAASYVRNAEEFATASNLEVKASADSLAGSASAHFDIDTQSAFEGTTINVVVNAVTDFGWWAMEAEPLHLTKGAQDLIEGRNFTEFEHRCGSRYVAMEHRASSAGIMISISSFKQSFKQSFEEDVSGNFGTGGMSASASAKFSSELKSALSDHRVSFQVFSTGGDGFGSLGDVVKGLAGQADPMEAIAAGLSKFLEKFGKNNPALYSFSVASMEKFGWDPASVEPWTDLKETQLRLMVSKYLELKQMEQNMRDYLGGGSWRQAIDNTEYGELTQVAKGVPLAIPYLQEQEVEFADSFKTCKDSRQLKTCLVPDIPPGLYGFIKHFKTPPPPQVEFVVEPYRDVSENSVLGFPNITGRRARAILSAPTPSKLATLRQFESEADQYKADLLIRGTFLDTMQVVFVNAQDGKEVGAFVPGPIGDLPWEGFPDNNPDKFQEARIEARYMNITHVNEDYTGDGTFVLKITDWLGRTFKFPLLDANWVSSDGTIVKLKKKYDY